MVRQTKTGSAARIAISAEVSQLLRALYKSRCEDARHAGGQLPTTAHVWSQDVFGSRPVYPDTISAAFRKVRKAAGLDHVELRTFRHYTATQLLAAGVDVRTVAGRLRHARPAMTLDRYAAWVPARDREAAEVLGSLGAQLPDSDPT